MASSNLHARHRKYHPPQEVPHGAPSSDGGRNPLLPIPSSTSSKRRFGRRAFFVANELRYALLAVVSFLFFGLLLGYFLMHHQHRRVIMHTLKNPWAHGGAVLRGRAGFRHHFYSGPARFVTVVMPSVVNARRRSRRLEAIQDTWGPYARAVYVVHNATSEFPAAVRQNAVIAAGRTPYDPYSFPQALEVPGDIAEDDGVPRLYHAIQTVHEKVDPDFAFFVNDHTFVVPEHLCKFLEHRDPKHDLYAGHALSSAGEKDVSNVFNSGAAGYVLSRETMKKMIERYVAKDPSCYLDPNSKDQNVKWLQGNPGLATLDCLNKLGVFAFDTRADKKWHRFHAFPLTRMVSGDIDDWYRNKHKGMSGIEGFDESYETVATGEACCSRTTISFHYVESSEARALFAVRQRLLTNPKLTDHELRALVEAEWPTDRKEIGAYSRGLPKDDDSEGWQSLLNVLRKISNRETQRDC